VTEPREMSHPIQPLSLLFGYIRWRWNIKDDVRSEIDGFLYNVITIVRAQLNSSEALNQRGFVWQGRGLKQR